VNPIKGNHDLKVNFLSSEIKYGLCKVKKTIDILFFIHPQMSIRMRKTNVLRYFFESFNFC
jgi:hypothetical protein